MSNEKEYAVYRSVGRPHEEWIRIREGQAGDGNALPLIVKKGRNNGAWVHSGADRAERGYRPSQGPGRAHFLQGIAGGEGTDRPFAGTGVEGNQAPSRLHRRADRDRAAGAETRSPSTGEPTASSGSSRWATIRWASTARASPAAWSGSSKTPTATASTTKRPCSSTVSASRPASCPGARACSSPALRTSSTPRTRDGDGKADQSRSLFTGFGEGNQQHRVNGFGWGLDDWIYCANGDSGGMVKSREDGNDSVEHQRPRLPHSGRTPATSRPRAGRRSTAAAATTGATGSATTTANRCWHYVSTTTTSAAIRTSPRRTPRADSVEPGIARLPDQPDAAAVQRSRGGQPLHVGLQRDRLPRRAVRPRVRRQHVRQRAGA